jgi:hypothetical protein
VGHAENDPISDLYVKYANANEIINRTLSNEYLQHELNLTLQKVAETGANTIVVPANMRGFEMILPIDKLVQR